MYTTPIALAELEIGRIGQSLDNSENGGARNAEAYTPSSVWAGQEKLQQSIGSCRYCPVCCLNYRG